jgi:hypothetical protein
VNEERLTPEVERVRGKLTTWGEADGVASKLAEKSATGKVERRWLGLFVAAMGALAIFAPARRLLRYALDFMHRSLLRQSSPRLRRAGSRLR